MTASLCAAFPLSGAAALAVAESISPDSLPKHAVPGKSWLVERPRSAAGDSRSPLARP